MIEKSVEFILTKENVERIYQLTANGLSKPDVAGCFGVTEKTFNKWVKKHREVRQAIGDGRYFGLQNATTRLRAAMDNGSVPAVMFYLKTRWCWRERDRPGEDINSEDRQKLEKINFKSMSPTEAARVYQQVMKGEK